MDMNENGNYGQYTVHNANIIIKSEIMDDQEFVESEIIDDQKYIKSEIIDDQKFIKSEIIDDQKYIKSEIIDDQPEEKYTEQEITFWEQLLDAVIWDFVLYVHRTVKMGALFLDPDLDPDFKLEMYNNSSCAEADHLKIGELRLKLCEYGKMEEDSEEQEETKNDASGQNIKKDIEASQVTCAKCKTEMKLSALGSHLLKCMKGIKGRNSSKEAIRKLTAAAADDDDEDEDEDEDALDLSPSTSFDRIRDTKFLRSKMLKSRFQDEDFYPSSPYLETPDDLEFMTFEEKAKFFTEKCGVMDKINGRCENSFNCALHTDEERELTRRDHLSNFDDDSNGEFDFDSDKDDKDECGFFVINY